MTWTNPTYYEEHQDELMTYLRKRLKEFLHAPRGEKYHHLKNKLAEYYSLSVAAADEAYAKEQDQMRAELGIGREG